MDFLHVFFLGPAPLPHQCLRGEGSSLPPATASGHCGFGLPDEPQTRQSRHSMASLFHRWSPQMQGAVLAYLAAKLSGPNGRAGVLKESCDQVVTNLISNTQRARRMWKILNSWAVLLSLPKLPPPPGTTMHPLGSICQHDHYVSMCL